MYNINSVLFDLDGTLIDTAPDLVFCLNEILKQNDVEPLQYDDAKTSVSKGSLAMIKHGFGTNHSETQIAEWQQALLNLYYNNICRHSTPFPGINETLDTLESQNVRWGIVTNKPAWLTEPLLKALNLFNRAACIVSGDTLPNRKPHPDPLLHACKLLNITAEQCIYFGDDERDVLSAKAANMPVVVALYGYIHSDERPEQWGTDYLIKKPGDIISWLNQYTNYNGNLL